MVALMRARLQLVGDHAASERRFARRATALRYPPALENRTR